MDARPRSDEVLDRRSSGLPEPSGVVRLDRDQVWTYRVPRGATLRVTCVSGLVWITQEGNARDHFLRGADTYVSREPGLVGAQAIAPSQLVVVAAKNARFRRDVLNSWRRHSSR
jgi:hypothetical protein